MKKFSFVENSKNFNLVSRVATLFMVGLIAATTFTAIPVAFAHNIHRHHKPANSNSSSIFGGRGGGPVSGSVRPALHNDPACQTNDDSLDGSNPYTLHVGTAPSCDRVDWIFPRGDTDGKNCTFQADGTFDNGLEIDFYDFRDGAPSDHGNPTPIASRPISGGMFTASGTNIVHAYLKPSTVTPASASNNKNTLTLGNISYSCASFPFGPSPNIFGTFNPPSNSTNGTIQPNFDPGCGQDQPQWQGDHYSLFIGNAPTCNSVTWTFPADTVGKTCLFTTNSYGGYPWVMNVFDGSSNSNRIAAFRIDSNFSQSLYGVRQIAVGMGSDVQFPDYDLRQQTIEYGPITYSSCS